MMIVYEMYTFKKKNHFLKEITKRPAPLSSKSTVLEVSIMSAIIFLINLKEIKPRHHLQLLKTFPKTTPDPSRIRTVMCESGP